MEAGGMTTDSGPWEARLRAKFASLSPTHLELENESGRHGGRTAASESHFRLVIVADGFAGLSRIDRHRKINDLVAEELRVHIHALGIQAFTPAEWAAKGERAFASPDCRGGPKARD